MVSNTFWTRIIYIVSVIISLVVGFLILGPRPENMEGVVDVSILPTVNAILNAITTILLIYGFVLIKNKKRQHHQNIMLTSFGTSALFLVTYVIYHWFKSGPKAYTGDYTILYYGVLISHIILAVFIIPLALFTLFHGWTDQLNRHRNIARITLPIWLYVSITGVIIYYMLYI